MNENLRKLTEKTRVAEGPTNIGIIETDDGVCIIDSGNDKDAGRRLLKILRAENLTLKTIINTHSNADHIGANAYLQNQTGCEIITNGIEAAFTETPILESSFLWGGYPFKQLRSKFFNAKPSAVTRTIDEDSALPGLGIVSLPGHFFGQIGILTEDGVFFIGDSIFGSHILEKYSIPFIYDVQAFRDSIGKIKSVEAKYYVPSHGEIEQDISGTADLNLKRVDEIENRLLEILSDELIFEDLFQRFCDLWNIELNHGQYVLVGSTIKSFLSYLSDEGRAAYSFRDNRMLWKSI